MTMKKYKCISKERCRQVFDLYRKKSRDTRINLKAFCLMKNIPYWVMRRWMRDNNETVRQARTGIPAKDKVRLPDYGIGFYCVDVEDRKPYRMIFRILPFDVVMKIGEILLSMNVCSACEIKTKTDTYRRDYVAERVELKTEGYIDGFSIEDLQRLCQEVAFARGYELYGLPVNDLINLKVKTAFNKRKRYI